MDDWGACFVINFGLQGWLPDKNSLRRMRFHVHKNVYGWTTALPVQQHKIGEDIKKEMLNVTNMTSHSI